MFEYDVLIIGVLAARDITRNQHSLLLSSSSGAIVGFAIIKAGIHVFVMGRLTRYESFQDVDLAVSQEIAKIGFG